MATETLRRHATTSTWAKGETRLWVTGKTEPHNPNTIFTFRGREIPFPCFEMVGSFPVLRDWLVNNGWKMEPVVRTHEYIDMISYETGEVLSSKEIHREYIATGSHVKETTPAPDLYEGKSIPELIAEGRTIRAVRNYRAIMGCDLAEAHDAVLKIRKEM